MALLVPCAVFASILLLGLTGGFGQLRGLGQAFGGPSVPAGSSSAAPPASGGGAAVSAPLLAVPGVTTSAPTGRLTAAAAPTPASGPSAGAPGTGPAAGSGPVNQPSGGGAGQTPTSGTGSPAPGPVSGPQPPQPPQAPPRPPSLVDQVVNLGTSVTSTLPAPVGPLATQLLQGVGKTVDNTLSGVTSGASRLLSGNRTQ